MKTSAHSESHNIINSTVNVNEQGDLPNNHVSDVFNQYTYILYMYLDPDVVTQRIHCTLHPLFVCNENLHSASVASSTHVHQWGPLGVLVSIQSSHRLINL